MAHGSPEALPSIESLLLQRLLAEVEARQITRAQPTYVIEQQTASRHTTLIRTLWSLLWALSVILCIFVVKYIDSQTIAPRSDAGQSRAIESLTASLGGQQKELSAMVDALQGLAGTIALDSTRAAAIPDILNRLTTEFQRVRPPLVRNPVDPGAPATTTQDAELAPIPLGGHHHAPIEGATVAPDGATVHYNSLGVMDYWLVPRAVAGIRSMVKVVPISQSSGGSFVHHVAEAKDYFLTSAGDWVLLPEGSGKQ